MAYKWGVTHHLQVLGWSSSKVTPSLHGRAHPLSTSPSWVVAASLRLPRRAAARYAVGATGRRHAPPHWHRLQGVDRWPWLGRGRDQSKLVVKLGIYGCFQKWWYPTTMGFPTKNDHFGVFWGYHHLRKHPYRFLLVGWVDEFYSPYKMDNHGEFIPNTWRTGSHWVSKGSLLGRIIIPRVAWGFSNKGWKNYPVFKGIMFQPCYLEDGLPGIVSG